MKRGKYIAKILLFPFSIIYGFVVFVRNRLFDCKIISVTSYDLPVICIGNISAGGTGKTPLVEYLISLLNKKYNVLYISRGYKRKTKGIVRASINSSVEDIGDEAVQVKQKFPDIEVVVTANRVKGIQDVILDSSCIDPDVILLDDAFQHRYIKPGLSLLLFDYYRPAYKDLILPAGRLREFFFERKRADILIVTKSPENLDPSEKRKIEQRLLTKNNREIFFTGLKYQKLQAVFNTGVNSINTHSTELHNSDILLITGIVNTLPLEEYLSGYTSNIKHFRFPDHYNFKKADIIKIKKSFFNLSSENKIIITTEKDAVRLRSSEYSGGINNLPVYYLPVKVIINERSKEFDKQILEYVESGKKSS